MTDASTTIRQSNFSRWPHRLAVALVVVTFPLLWVGGLVTTYDAGMAVPDWPNTYGYNLFLYPWQTWIYGPWDLFIEHGHRLLGAAVGMLMIALVVVVWRCDRRRWLRYLSLAALAAVILQGSLGGLRVILDETEIAKLHGCFGPVFFSLAVSMGVFTSRLWQSNSQPKDSAGARRLQRLAAITTFLAYIQLVLGAQLRHLPQTTLPGQFRTAVAFHLIMAGVLLLHVILTVTRVVRQYAAEPALLRPAVALGVLILVQLGLGAGTWIVKYGPPLWLIDFEWLGDWSGYVVTAEGRPQAHLITAHVATGSLILVTSLLLTLRSLRLLHEPAGPALTRRASLGVAV